MSISLPFSLRVRLLLTSIALLTLAVYWPGLSGGFALDDFNNIVNNGAISPTAVHSHFWAAIWSSGSGPTDRPLSMLTFAIQSWFTGLAPWPLKLVNTLIHITNGLLVFLLTRSVLCFVRTEQIGRHKTPTNWLITPHNLALLITAAWLLAPIQLTAVLYVVQRMESLSALFVLAGLLVYWQGRMRLLNGRNGGWWRVWLGLVGGTFLAIFAKETGVMLPVYAFLLEWLILKGRTAQGRDERFIWLYALILFLPGAAGIIYTLPNALNGTAYADRSFDLEQRLLTEGRILIDYLHWIIAPSPDALNLYHDDIPLSTSWLTPWTTVTSWTLIAGLITAALWLKDRAPLFSLGVLWFFAGHTLVSTYLPLEIAYEHRNYLPSLGVFISLFGLLFSWASQDRERRNILRTLTVVSAMALIVMYTVFTALRAQTWGNPYRLSYFQATTHPDSPRASYALGRNMMITASGGSSPLFQTGMAQMEKTSKLPGASIQAEQALIFAGAKYGLPIPTARWQTLRAQAVSQPIGAENISALYGLINCGINGICKYSPADITELGATLEAVVAKYPDNAALITLYSNYATNITHDFSLAYKLMQRAVAINPKKYDYWKNLVTLQTATGQFRDAQAGIERMHELNGKGLHDTDLAALQKTLREKEASSYDKAGAKN